MADPVNFLKEKHLKNNYLFENAKQSTETLNSRWNYKLLNEKAKLMPALLGHTLISSLNLNESRGAKLKKIIDSEYFMKDNNHALLVESFKRCENYGSILTEGVPSKKFLSEKYRNIRKRLLIKIIQKEICTRYNEMFRPVIAKAFYYTGFQFQKDRDKFEKIHKIMENIDLDMEAGNIPSVYYQLMMINKKVINLIEKDKLHEGG